MIVNVASNAALYTALKSAQAGDTIQLAPGSYSLVKLYGMNFSSEVTVTSMDPNNPAVLAGLNVANSSNLTFTNLEVKIDPITGFAVYLGSDKNIKLDGLNMHGSAVGDSNAVMARNSTNITVTDSDIHHLGTGINHLNSNGLTFSGNRLHDLQADGIRGSGSSNVTITDNHFTNFYPKTGDHPDGIQFWTYNTTTPAHDIVISGNVFVRGAGGAIQGIFIGNENKIPYQNVTVTDNAIIGGMYHGISLSYGDNVTVAGNLVAGYADMTSWIMLNYTTNSRITDNDATAYQLSNGNINLLNTLNSSLSQLALGDLLTLNNWLAQHGDTAAETPAPAPLPPAPEPAPAFQPLAVETPTIIGTNVGERLTGGAGEDVIDGKGGVDTMTGGAGDDHYVVDNVNEGVVEVAGGGVDTVQTYLWTYTLSDQVERLLLTGTSNQAAYGNGLDNVIQSNGFKSSLNGAAGNDTLVSMGGQDALTGGAGADVFRFEKAGAMDIVTDFTKGQDVLDLQALMANYAGSDPVADKWLKFVSDGSGTTVYLDADGAAGPGGFMAIAKLNGFAGGLTAGSDYLF